MPATQDPPAKRVTIRTAPCITPQRKVDICSWIAGGKSLAAWCRKHGVAYRSVTEALAADSEFALNYARARMDSADADADLVSDLRQQVIAGTLAPDAARVAIDACKWTAGKRQPKVYGDRIAVEHAGAVIHGTLAELNAAIENRQSELARVEASMAAEHALEAGPIVDIAE